MAIDEEIDALQKQIELEDASGIPFAGQTLDTASALLALLHLSCPPVQMALSQIRKRLDKTKQHRAEVYLETLIAVSRRLDRKVSVLEENQQDSARKLDKATATRSEERIRRIGTILAHGLAALADGEDDEIDEMMRLLWS